LIDIRVKFEANINNIEIKELSLENSLAEQDR